MTHDPRRPFTVRGGAAEDLPSVYLVGQEEVVKVIKNDSNNSPNGAGDFGNF
jgi:hypothetical protein